MSKFIYVLHGKEGAQCINAYKLTPDGGKYPHGYVYLDNRFTAIDGSETYEQHGTPTEQQKLESWAEHCGGGYNEWFQFPALEAKEIKRCKVLAMLRARGYTKIRPFPEK